MEMIISLFMGFIAYRLVKEGGIRTKKRIKTLIVDIEKTHAKSLLLFFLMIILTVPLFFSLSRGGMVIIMAAFLFFILMINLWQKHARGPVVIGIICCILLFFYLSYLGMEPIFKGLQSLSEVV